MGYPGGQRGGKSRGREPDGVFQFGGAVDKNKPLKERRAGHSEIENLPQILQQEFGAGFFLIFLTCDEYTQA